MCVRANGVCVCDGEGKADVTECVSVSVCARALLQTILVMASVLGVLRFFRPRTVVPPDSRFESFAQKAFAAIDSDHSDTISRHEFHSFMSNVAYPAPPCSASMRS